MLGSIQSKIGVVAGVVLVAALIAFAGYSRGKADAAAEAAKVLNAYKDEVRAREQEQERLLAEADSRNRELEKAHEQRIADLRAQFARAQAEARLEDERVIADLRSGNQRLRLRVSACSASSQAGAIESAAPGVDGTGTAELAPEAAAAIWGIAADGDRAIRKLTALQDWAQLAVQLCNPTPMEATR